MTLQNIRKIKGAADKNWLKDVMCEQGLIRRTYFWAVSNFRTNLHSLTVTAAPNYDCSYGESYWCSNLSIAKKCGAVQHCMDTVWRNTDLTGMKVIHHTYWHETNHLSLCAF